MATLDSPVPGELLFSLTEREGALLGPEVQRLAVAKRAATEAQDVIARMLRLRAGRDDVTLYWNTMEVRVSDGNAEQTPPRPDNDAANLRISIALNDYLHTLAVTEPLDSHLSHGLAQRLADVALAAVNTPDADFDAP
jgi:hypothetical protein